MSPLTRPRLLALFLATAASLWAGLVPADSPHIRYSGRIDDAQPETVVFGWSGARVRMAFEGDSIGMHMDALHKNNWVNVLIDGRHVDKLLIEGKGGHQPLASDLGPGPHTIEIVKATEGMVGNLAFKGFTLPDDGQSLPWPKTETRRIEFIGDSITCGYGIEADGPNNPFLPETENFSDSYAAHAIRALDADYLVVARSGIGMLRNYGGPAEGNPTDNMPAVYDRTLFKNATPKWDTARFTPDVVCVNLCTNDFSGKGPDRQLFEDNYTAFVRRLQGQYPAARIVLLLGPMTTKPEIREILERVAANTGDQVSFFQLSGQGKHGFGAHYHPSKKQGEINGTELAAHLSQLMDWPLAQPR
ncbi:MAG: SGNH/GDSL hydrolase family protein [Verrucomicrobiota bacterium]